jgi:hypothetical protein
VASRPEVPMVFNDPMKSVVVLSVLDAEFLENLFGLSFSRGLPGLLTSW